MRSVNTVNLVLSVLVITRGGFEVGAACSQRAGFTTLYHEAIQNKALFNHVFKSLTNTIDRVECFQACVGDCRCMSYNFQENPSVDGTRHCELNSADYKSDTFALMIRAGFAYYDIRPIFNSAQQVSKCWDQSCHMKCCQSSPCQNGGECHEVSYQKKRLRCKCTAGFTGELCTIKAKSCLDHFRFNRSAIPGFYDIQDDNGAAFTVFCDFDESAKFAWTLVMSYTFANNAQFKAHPLYKDHPVAENLLNWAAYRLSKARMLSIQSQSSKWRATCNYNTDGLILTDYVRSTFANVDPMTLHGSGCKKMEYINIRGKGCDECTAWCDQASSNTFLLGNWYGQFKSVQDGIEKCSYVNAAGTITHESSFGYYKHANSGHRCASTQLSTTQYWFGSGMRY